MPDTTPPVPLFQHGTDAEVALALVLEQHGRTTIRPPLTLNERDLLEVVAWRTVDGDPDALTLEARRCETYAERAERILRQRVAGENLDGLARDLLEALGADPDRVAPPVHPT